MSRPRHLLLRADADPEIGAGHVMRALALAQAWRASGGAATLLSRPLPAPLAARLRAEEVSLASLSAPAGGEADGAATGALAATLGATWIVADGYALGPAWQAAARAGGARLLFVDDDAQVGRYAADAVLDQNLDADPRRYEERAPEATLLLGSQYALLRREFTVRVPRAGGRGPARRVLVTFGGADPRALTPTALRVLAGLDLPALEVRVVVGGANAGAAAVAEACAALSARGHATDARSVGADMPEHMEWADLAITAAGTTCWELAYFGVPAVAVVAAANQRRIAERLVASGAAVHGGDAESLETTLPTAVAPLLDAVDRLAHMSARARAIVDGRGADRVLAALAAVA